MKKYLIIGFLVISTVLTSLSSCEKKVENVQEDVSKMENPFKVYLAKDDNEGIEPIYIDYKIEKNREMILGLITDLKEGAVENSITTIPKSLEIIDIQIIENNVRIYFSGDYHELEPFDEIIVRSALVKTLTGIDGVESVEFYVVNAPLTDFHGKAYGPMNGLDIMLDHNETGIKEPTKDMVLYFANATREELVQVNCKININKNERIEKTIIDRLIKGPSTSEYRGLISEETIVKSVYTNKGICYVDLSKEFISQPIGGDDVEELAVYSLVNTLTELPTVSKVQFLVEGKIEEEYKGDISLENLFSRNLNLVNRK